MITGRCVICVYICPRCDSIHQGEATGGIFKKCKPCAFYGMCDARQEVKEERMKVYESICDDCLLEVVRNLTEYGGE